MYIYIYILGERAREREREWERGIQCEDTTTLIMHFTTCMKHSYMCVYINVYEEECRKNYRKKSCEDYNMYKTPSFVYNMTITLSHIHVYIYIYLYIHIHIEAYNVYEPPRMYIRPRLYQPSPSFLGWRFCAPHPLVVWVIGKPCIVGCGGSDINTRKYDHSSLTQHVFDSKYRNSRVWLNIICSTEQPAVQLLAHRITRKVPLDFYRAAQPHFVKDKHAATEYSARYKLEETVVSTTPPDVICTMETVWIDWTGCQQA